MSFGIGSQAPQTIGGVPPFYSQQAGNLNMTSHHLDDYGSAGAGVAQNYQNPAENSMYAADMTMYARGFQQPAPMGPKVIKSKIKEREFIFPHFFFMFHK